MSGCDQPLSRPILGPDERSKTRNFQLLAHRALSIARSARSDVRCVADVFVEDDGTEKRCSVIFSRRSAARTSRFRRRRRRSQTKHASARSVCIARSARRGWRAAFLARAKTNDVSAPSLVQDSGTPACSARRRAIARRSQLSQSQLIGLLSCPLSHTIRWRWQPVERPVLPTSPITCPRLTR
jgi:hypothetical protein